MQMPTAESLAAYTTVQHLRLEPGWREVAAGIGRIFMSYVVVIVGAVLTAGMVALCLTDMLGKTGGKSPLLVIWVFFLSLMAFGLVCLFSYGLLLVGLWRCLMNASERHAARWLMFGCITCMVMGPVMNFTFGLTGMEQGPTLSQGPDGFAKIRFSTSAIVLQAASSLIGVAGHVLFLLFLRAAALCFNDHGRANHVTVYVVFWLAITFGPALLAFADLDLLLRPEVLCLLVLAWVLSFFWYLYLLLTMYACISSGISNLPSPLEM